MKDRPPIRDRMINIPFRERQALVYAGRGSNRKETAAKIGITDHTASMQRRTLFERFGVNSMPEAMVAAVNAGMDVAEIIIPDFDPNVFAGLSQGNKNVVFELGETGGTDKDIAAALKISPNTVKNHFRLIRRITRLNTREEIVANYLEAKRRAKARLGEDVELTKEDIFWTPDVEEEELLTKREKEVLSMIGKSVKKIAAELKIRKQTVKNHFYSVYKKVGAHNRTEAVVRALQLGAISLEEFNETDFPIDSLGNP